MKTIKELFIMLVDELTSNIDNIKSKDSTLVYYNEILGDTSFLLAGLLESLLNKNINEWDNSKWFDDSLISEIILQNKKLKIYGVMIWGANDTTEQWTEPFCFEIELPNEAVNSSEYTFLFGDLDYSEITFEAFRDNRDYWTAQNRNWKYIIKSKEVITEI